MRIARRAAAVASVAAVALTLTACAGAAESADEPTASASSDSIFPVSIDSTLGTAEIEKKPERVVTLGWGAADIAFSLGTVPVGIEEDTWGGDADGYQPWFRDAVEDEGAELPETIAMYPELDVDAIIALEPDLVLAPQSGLEQDVFDQLSAFVPVVAYPGEPWQTSLEDQVNIAAEALGVPEKADPLLAERQAAIDTAAEENPELSGLTFAYVYGGDQPGALSVYLPGDPRVELLTGLGLELAPSVSTLSASPGTFVSTLGLENADQLERRGPALHVVQQRRRAGRDRGPAALGADPGVRVRCLRPDARPAAGHGRLRGHAAERAVGHRRVRPAHHGRRGEGPGLTVLHLAP